MCTDDRREGLREELSFANYFYYDGMLDENPYSSDFASLDRYFFHFTMATRAGR